MTKFTDLRGASLTPIHIGSVWQACGKPSTKFPHGGLVECPFFLHPFSKFPTISLNFQIFTKNKISSKFSSFSKILKF